MKKYNTADTIELRAKGDSAIEERGEQDSLKTGGGVTERRPVRNGFHKTVLFFLMFFVVSDFSRSFRFTVFLLLPVRMHACWRT